MAHLCIPVAAVQLRVEAEQPVGLYADPMVIEVLLEPDWLLALTTAAGVIGGTTAFDPQAQAYSTTELSYWVRLWREPSQVRGREVGSWVTQTLVSSHWAGRQNSCGAHGKVVSLLTAWIPTMSQVLQIQALSMSILNSPLIILTCNYNHRRRLWIGRSRYQE